MALSVFQFGIFTIVVVCMAKAGRNMSSLRTCIKAITFVYLLPDHRPPSCVQNLPLLDGQRETSNTLENDIQAIVPEYVFSCHGNVTEWQAYIYPLVSGRRHTIELRVWRELATDGRDNSTEPSYALTGSNIFQDVMARRGFLELAVETEDQIQVQPGDVVGFSFSSSSAGILLDTGNSAVRVLQYDSNDLMTNRLFLADLQDSALLGAPAVTAIVGKCLVGYQVYTYLLVPAMPQKLVLTPTATIPQQPTPTSVSSATQQQSLSPQSCASLVSESTGGASPSPEVENENTDDFDPSRKSPPYLAITAAIGGTVLVLAIGFTTGVIIAVRVIKQKRKGTV